MLPEMRTKAVRWITDCLMIYGVLCASSVGAQGSSRALLLYSSDSPPTASPANNLISIQLDSITLNKIIAESEALGKVVKKINFRNVNGFAKLVEGESSKFSFLDDGGRSCDVSCDARCKELPKPTVSVPKPFVTRKPVSTGPTYLPPVSTRAPPLPSITKRDESITPRTTTRPTLPTSRPTLPTSTRYIPSTTPRLIPSTTTRSNPTPKITTTLRSTSTTTQRPTFATRPRSSTPGPTYLPVSRVSTERRSTVTERSYPPATWPSTTRIYTQSFPTWSAPIRRSTDFTKTFTTTAKYLYKEPSNSLIYAGEAE